MCLFLYKYMSYIWVYILFQTAVDDKDSILAGIPADLREKGSELYDSLIDGKVLWMEET